MTDPTPGGLSVQANLDGQIRDLAEAAGSANSGRASHMLVGGPGSTMTQTLIALRSGAVLHEHENPGEATLIVLRGRVRLLAGDQAGEAGDGDVVVIPMERHSLEALSDSVVLLTAAKVRQELSG